jgi:16S rRNA pseudouridine516 synthase
MRLDKFISHATGMTRQQAQRAVRAGLVTVNAIVTKKSEQAVTASDEIIVEGERVVIPALRYFMLHKPLGYICANHDSHHPVVIDLIHEKNAETLQIVGRLDIDTTGLVLLTDDGQWNHRITAPSSSCIKTYCVQLQQPLTDEAITALSSGVALNNEKNKTKPAVVTVLDDSRQQVRIAISEGKYHQVKRMFAAVGNHVLALHRERIGNLVLDKHLAVGEYRALTHDEVESVLLCC